MPCEFQSGPCGANVGTDHEEIPTQNVGGPCWEDSRNEKQTGVICIALEVDVAGAAVAAALRGKAPRYYIAERRHSLQF
jgi:hypothetical protein